MKVIYYALVPFDTYEVGDLIPSAGSWPARQIHVEQGRIASTLVAVLPADVQQQIAEWEGVEFDPDANKGQVLDAAAIRAQQAEERKAREAAERKQAAEEAAEQAKAAAEAAQAAAEAAQAQSDADADDAEPVSIENASYSDLKEMAANAGHEFAGNISKSDLISLLTE